MCATGRIAMGTMLPRRPSFGNNGSHRLRAGGIASLLGLVLSLMLSATASAQSPVTGTVSSTSGQPLPGVTVRVAGTEVRTVTDARGRYSIAAPAEGVLMLSL